jgi:hypothetical protein
VINREQPVIDVDAPVVRPVPANRRAPGLEQPGDGALDQRRRAGEQAARDSLKAQIARLERELSRIVADTFPHLPVPGMEGPAGPGPRLLGLGELERSRDRLAGRVQLLRRRAAARVEHERRAREQLERMKLEPGRYKFVRLPVSDLGQGGCGVWEVRPRLGLIGMLAGWWQLKLSSGCPLARGPRSKRDPSPPP